MDCPSQLTGNGDSPVAVAMRPGRLAGLRVLRDRWRTASRSPPYPALSHPRTYPPPACATGLAGCSQRALRGPLAALFDSRGSPRGLFGLADFAKSLRFANSISHALSHPPSSSAWATFALSAPRVARALLGAFAGPTQGRTLYCPVTAVHLPTRRIYPSAGSIRWIYPLDLPVGSIRW